MQALPPIPSMKNAPYGSVFHWHEDPIVYPIEKLAKWTDRELLIKHYHLTARLDGYNHLEGDSRVAKINAVTFRDALWARGIDGVAHCMRMDLMYNWGYRKVQVFYPKALDNI